MLYLGILAVMVLLLVITTMMGMANPAIMAAIVIFCSVIMLLFKPKSTDVDVYLREDMLRIIPHTKKAKKGQSSEESDDEMRFELHTLHSFSVDRSGRYSELLRVVMKDATTNTTIVFSGPPSPEKDDPIRRLERALKEWEH